MRKFRAKGNVFVSVALLREDYDWLAQAVEAWRAAGHHESISSMMRRIICASHKLCETDLEAYSDFINCGKEEEDYNE